MSMGMSLGMQLRQVLRLEQRQELKLEMKQMIPKEFMEFINLESDDDLDLLKKSLPFLVLHEVSHPLYDDGRINIPKLRPSQRLQQRITELGYIQAFEIGIDAGAMLIGEGACDYSPAKLYRSHAAIAERVHRDIFKLHKFEPEYGFLARIEAVLQENGERSCGSARSSIHEMENTINEDVKKAIFGKGFTIYTDMVKAYRRVYKETSLVGEIEKERNRSTYGYFVN